MRGPRRRRLFLLTVGLGLVGLGGCQIRTDPLDRGSDLLTITITLEPVGPDQVDPGGGLRSLMFHDRQMPIEPHARYADGSPVSADALISRDEMRAIADELQHFDEWSKAVGLREQIQGHLATRPGAEVRVSFRDGTSQDERVATFSWGEKTLKLLDRINRRVSSVSLAELIATSKRS